MILRRLYEEYDLSIERILLKEYKRLGLTMQENQVLLALFSIYKKRRTFSINAISKRVELSHEDIGNAVESLMDKRFVQSLLETTKEGKEREVFTLEGTFKHIEDLYQNDELERQKEKAQNDIMETISSFEEGLGRSLRPYELDNIRRWYEEGQYSHQDIKEALLSSEDRVSIKYVERILNQKQLKPIQIDPEVEDALDEIFKSIK